uniref:Uncharacterized protein n=1 Tax=Ditylenchus dipsaci TaxID=166011 RepID=A0A915ETA3_9BILA
MHSKRFATDPNTQTQCSLDCCVGDQEDHNHWLTISCHYGCLGESCQFLSFIPNRNTSYFRSSSRKVAPIGGPSCPQQSSTYYPPSEFNAFPSYCSSSSSTMIVKRDANNNQGANTSLTTSRHSSKNFEPSNLICAELANNRLTKMPDFLSSDHLDSLETLVLRNNCLRGQLFAFPPNLKTISYLDLSGNHLNSLPNCLFNLPLKVLLLSSNKLDCLSPKISNLNDTLEELDLSFNRLKCCPPEIGMLSCLSVLNLKNNQLTQLTPAIGQISPLRLLNLSNNHLSHLPSQLHVFAGALRSGIDLQVDGNPLVSPPIRVAIKGRLHMAKWLRNLAVEESNQVEGILGAKISSQEYGWNGVNNRREANVNQPLKPQAKNTILPSKSVVKQSEPGKSLGSDSGYASTVDEHRLSHEYTNGSLEDICQGNNQQKPIQPDSEKQLCTMDLNKEIMLAYAQTVIEKKKTVVTNTTPCLKPTSNNNDCTFLPLQQQSTTNQPSLENKTIAQYRQNTAIYCLQYLKQGWHTKPGYHSKDQISNHNRQTKPQQTRQSKPISPKSLSSSCSPCSSMCSVVENLPTATIKIADSSVVQAKKIDQLSRNGKSMTTSLHQPPKSGQLKPTSASKCLPPPKARRNIENFIAACRKLVPEASICAAADIMGRQRNSGQVARTVLALNKCVKK